MTDELRAYKAAWYQAHREQCLSREKARNVLHKEEKRAYDIAYREENFEELKRKKQQYLDATAEHVRTRKKAYRLANIQHIKQKDKLRAVTHREENRKYKESYYAKNGEKLKAKSLAYAKANPEKCLAAAHKRRALKQGATVGELEVIVAWEKRWRKLEYVRCYWCLSLFSPSNCHSDHIVALCLKGPHSISNLVISCASCNLRKNNSTIADWNKRIKNPILL